MNAQQSHLIALAPVLAKQQLDLRKDFVVELRGRRQSVGTGNGGEIAVAQLELQRAGVEAGFALAAAHHLRQTHQRGFQLLEVSSVFVVGMLVADGLDLSIGADFTVEPAAGIFAAGFASKS